MKLSQRFRMGRFLRRSLTTGGITIGSFGLLVAMLGAAAGVKFAIWAPIALGVSGLGLVLLVLSRVLSRGRALILDDAGLMLIARGKARRVPWTRVTRALWSTADEVVDTTEDTVVTDPAEDWVLILTVDGEPGVRVLGRDFHEPGGALAALERQFPRGGSST